MGILGASGCTSRGWIAGLPLRDRVFARQSQAQVLSCRVFRAQLDTQTKENTSVPARETACGRMECTIAVHWYIAHTRAR